MVKISSTQTDAVQAVSGVKAVTTTNGEQVSLEKSTVNIMKTGTTVNNKLLSDANQLITCVQKHSEKFPQIAELIALRDSELTVEGGE